MRVLVVSTYELGHQPLSVATTAAALLAAGHQVRCADLAVGTLSADDVDWAEGVALSVPMHTAMRLALRVAGTVRARRPGLPLCFYGLYAAMAGDLTVSSPADAVIAGEFEPGVVAWAGGAEPGPAVQLGRTGARVPDRSLLPELGRYTHLAIAGELRPVGSVAASRGCSHRCRHCPVPVVYDGRVRPVAEDVVLADVDQLVAAGARHISFADPDFLNAPRHARRVMAAVHDRHPGLTFDATIKVEHLLRYPEALPELAEAGCAFVVSAFELVSDHILAILAKGHTVADMSEAVTAPTRARHRGPPVVVALHAVDDRRPLGGPGRLRGGPRPYRQRRPGPVQRSPPRAQWFAAVGRAGHDRPSGHLRPAPAWVGPGRTPTPSSTNSRRRLPPW